MKHLTLRLREAIRRGILRIFPLPPLSLKMPPVTVALALALASCASHRQAIRPPRNVSADTVRLSSQLYDSVYICRDRLLDRSRDTVYLRDVSVECRYKLLRDTVYRTRVDSVPVIREVEVVREVPHVPWWARFCRAVTVAAALAVIAYLACVFRFRPPSRGVTHR